MPATMDSVPQLRPEREVMQLERMGAMQPSALSFAQSFIRRLDRERWRVERSRFALDDEGRGVASYRISPPGGLHFTVVLYSYVPTGAARSDRIINNEWDVAITLVEGDLDEEQLASQEAEHARLYEGRATSSTLVWAHGQRSVRAFQLTVDALAEGRQPPAEVLAATGYLIRNAGMDGNGTFGTKTFAAYDAGHPLGAPYAAQMLVAYVVREFSFDLVDHLAARRGGAEAVRLSPELRRYLGVGNSSGLGLILFINRHADLLDRWLTERERRLALARGLPLADDGVAADLVDRLEGWAVDRAADRTRNAGMTVPPGAQVAAELRAVSERITRAASSSATVAELVAAVEADPSITLETEELLASALIDLVCERLEPAEEPLFGTPPAPWDPLLDVAAVRNLVRSRYDWALRAPGEGPDRALAWYQSRTAEEPRRGPSASLPSPRFDQTLDLQRELQDFMSASAGTAGEQPIGLFLIDHPALRACVERVVADRDRAYHTLHADQRSRSMHAPHAIRVLNSAFFGISKTREQGPLGVSGVLLLGAPSPSDFGTPRGEWTAPVELGELRS